MKLKEGFKQYPKILILGLLVSLVASYFSIGYHHPDEHWQINEFVAYKLGQAKFVDMPWELGRESRQTIQPAIVYFFAKILNNFGDYNPFNLALYLRILSAILAFIATNLLVLQARNHFKSDSIFKYCLFFANFFWFIPYVHARFNGENWSGIFLAFGIYFIIKSFENKFKYLLFFISGIFLGLAFDMRYQIVFSIAGVGLWLI